MESLLEQLKEDVLIVDIRGKIKYCNERLRLKLEYSKEQMQKFSLKDLVVQADVSLKQVVEGSYSIRFRARDGKLRDYAIKIKKAEWKKEESYYIICKEKFKEETNVEELAQILDHIPYMILVKSLEGRYIYVNQILLDEFECKREDFIGKTGSEIFGEKIGSAIEEMDLCVVKNGWSRKFKEMELNWRGIKKCMEIEQLPFYDAKGTQIGIIKLLKKREGNKTVDTEKYVAGSPVDMMKGLNAQSCSVWLYDEKKISIQSVFTQGSYKNWEKKGEVRINDLALIERMKKGEYEGVITLDHYAIEKYKERLKKNNVAYVGTYNIAHKGEFFGIIHFCYQEGYEPVADVDERARRICRQLGRSIYQSRLAKRLQEELVKRGEIEEELEHFLDTAADVMMVVDQQGEFLKVSQSFCKVLGRSESEVVGQHSGCFLHPEDVELTRRVGRSYDLKEGRIRKLTNRYLSKEGKCIWIEWRIKYLENRGVFSCTGRNITEEKNLEEQKKFYQEKVQKKQLKNEFFSNISHEFRTPLNVILTTQALMEGAEKERVCIRQSAYRMLRLVNNMMEMTKLESGYYQLEAGNYNIVEIIEDITLSVVEYIQDKNILLTFDTEIEEEFIVCDPDRIERIMLNLLSNAIKHTPDNGHIWVEVATKQNKVVISVSDNGEGIPKHKMEKLFKKFEQIGVYGCRGLGLALTKGLVEAHGGSIQARSKLGRGTKISFELPIHVTSELMKEKPLDERESSRKKRCQIELSDINK